MKHLMSFSGKCLGSLSLLMVLATSNIAFAQQKPAVIKLEETIRGSQEQPKVLTIVPWQAPTAKKALPSAIVERINKKFVPLQREELTRQIKLLEADSGAFSETK